MMSSSLRKLVVGSNNIIINRSVNPFTRSYVIHGALGSPRIFNTTRSSRDLMYVDHLLNKECERFNERKKLVDSSDAVWIGPSRVKDDAQSLCLYLKMPGVLEEDLKVSVEHKSIAIKGRLNEKAHSLLGIKKYYCWLDSENIDRFKLTDIKAEMKRESGVLKLTIPKLKQQEVSVFNVKVDYIE